jgi:16S rRNA (cytidine1402-2'-O)-methyltransferase
MKPAEQAVGRLVVCPTPIGNLEDVTLRVLAALREADVVACEDTRHTRVLLERYGLTARLVSFHEHNEAARARELVAQIREGAVVALVSDGGTPVVSDPGFRLVRACLEEDLRVEVLPGPSAVVTALVASGLPPERWLFAGFLPRKHAELTELLSSASATLVAFESPRRLEATLRLLAALDPERPLAVCRELSKLNEEVRRGSAAELAVHYGSGHPTGQEPGGGGAGSGRTGSAPAAPTRPVRGEIVLVIGAASPVAARRAAALAALRELIDAGAKSRPAAAVIARLTGLGANELYRELNRGDSSLQ